MNLLKKVALLGLLVSPMAAFAAGTATGTITALNESASTGQIVFVNLSGLKTGGPACSTGAYEFVLPRSSAFYNDLFELLVNARNGNQAITIQGTGTCSIAATVETVNAVTY